MKITPDKPRDDDYSAFEPPTLEDESDNKPVLELDEKSSPWNDNPPVKKQRNENRYVFYIKFFVFILLWMCV